MTKAMPFLQKYDITFLRPPTITPGASIFLPVSSLLGALFVILRQGKTEIHRFFKKP